MVGFSFVGVGEGTSIDLTTVTVTGYNPDEGSSDEVNIQVLDALGVPQATYFWNDYWKKDKKTGEQVHYVGWMLDGDFILEGEHVFPTGTGFWAVAPSEAYKILCNGQVYQSALPVTLRENAKIVGNPYPCAIDLADITVSGYEEESSDEVNVQVLNSLGVPEETYFWNDYWKKDKKTGEQVHYVGWMLEGDFILDDQVFVQPGDGLWVVAPSTDYKLNFPELAL